MQPILDFIKHLFDLFVESGLAEKTADTIGRMITYTAEELIPLMWEYIHALGG